MTPPSPAKPQQRRRDFRLLLSRQWEGLMTVSELARNARFPRSDLTRSRPALYIEPALHPRTRSRTERRRRNQAAQARPCVPRGRPSLAAIVSATSARLDRAPIGPGGAPAPKARIGK